MLLDRRAVRGVWAAVAMLLLASSTALVTHDEGSSGRLRATGFEAEAMGGADFDAAADTAAAEVTTTTTAPPPPPTTAAPAPPTTSAPVLAAPAPPKAPVARAAGRPSVGKLTPPPVPVGLAPYVGLGTWLDVYDWTATNTNGRPAVGLADIDAMADRGVQTLYIQASKWDAAGDLSDPDLLMPLLRRAKERGMRVVGWYLPTLENPQRDLERLVAIARLQEVDSVGVDIESRTVGDVAERNRRLVELSHALREALPGRTIGAIVLPPVVLEVVNTKYWPNFPYKEIAPYYDVWMTMGYWTNRTQSSGYRDAYRYTKENVDRLRANVGRADLPVHPIGGIGDKTTPADVESFRKAAIDTTSIGGSLYDWRTTKADAWPGMSGFRSS